MNAFFKKVKKLQHKHLHELALMCGSMALLVAVVAIASSGIPRQAHAWTIDISPFTYTPVSTGGYTTISWYANSAQICSLIGPTLPCTSGRGGRICSQTVYGTTGSVNTGPITGPTSYTLSCYSPPGCSWWCYSGSGSASLTVYPTTPTPTTLTSFTATPSSVISGSRSTLSWSGAKGTNFSACQLRGGQWGAGTWFSALPGSVQTNPLTVTTTYSMGCYDTTGASIWKNTTVTVTTPLGPCNDIPTQLSVPGNCVTPTPAPGTCVPTGGSYSSTANRCSCPAGQHVSGTACVADPLCSNGLNDSYAPSCVCPAGRYQPLGGSACIPLPVCANGLNASYSPGCTCPAGQVQVPGGSTCIAPGTINNLNANPTRVRKGGTATLTWSTSNMDSCTLRGPSAGIVTTLSTALSGTRSITIANQSTYTLTCVDTVGTARTQTTIVNLVPETIEQ